MAEQRFNQAVSRLAQYRPFAHEGRDQQGAVRDLLLGAAAEAGGGFDSLGAAQEAVRTLWGLEVEIDELREVVKRLVEEGACVRAGGGFQLSDAQHHELEALSARSAEDEAKAFADWEETVRGFGAELSDDDLAALREDLDIWLQRVISRHGVEAALILYPEDPRARELYDEIEQLGLDFLEDRGERLEKVRERAIQTFVQRPTAEQRTYLSNLLHVSYFLTVLSLDPKASHLVVEQIKGHRIYLDTNVIYRTLGLSRMSEAVSARRLLDLSRQLGFEIAITPWTLEELKRSLARAEDQVKQRALPPREWAHLMAEATTQEGFIKAYWIQYKAKGVTPEDFFAFYSAIETILEEDGVKVVSDGTQKVQDADVEDQMQLLGMIKLWEHRDAVLRHDAQHRVLVEQLRGAGNLTFANARYWFLTQDSALPRYAELSLEGETRGVPFCSSTSAWAQVVRSLVPRTEDLDQVLVDLLASPYMRYRGGVSAQAVQDVVARIDQFKGVSEPLASEVLLNGALIRDIAATKDPDERLEKIDNALVKGAEDLHMQVEALTEREARAKEDARAAHAAKQSSEAKVEAAHARVAALERELAEQRTKEEALASRLSEAEATRQAAEDRAAEKAQLDAEERDALEKRLGATERAIDKQKTRDEKRGRTVKWTSAGLLWAAGVTATTLLLALKTVTDVWPNVGVLLGGLALVCLGIWVAWGWKRAWQTFLVIGAVIGVVAGLQQVVASLDDNSGEPKAAQKVD